MCSNPSQGKFSFQTFILKNMIIWGMQGQGFSHTLFTYIYMYIIHVPCDCHHWDRKCSIHVVEQEYILNLMWCYLTEDWNLFPNEGIKQVLCRNLKFQPSTQAVT